VITELLAAAVLVYSGSQNVGLTGFADGKMHVDFGSEIDQMSASGDHDPLVFRICCGESVMSPDGTIWYSTGSAVVRVRHDQLRTRDVFPFQLASALAAGPDGSLWFNSHDRFLTHIDANGLVQKFVDPHSAYSPRWGTDRIVVSNDGAAWCESYVDAFLARVDVTGATTIASGPNYHFVDLIAPARLGGVWVRFGVENNQRMDAVDHVAETLPMSLDWFVETNDGAIWYGSGSEITQWKSGTITRIPLPAALPPQYFFTLSEMTPESDTTIWVRTNANLPVPSGTSAEMSATSTPVDTVHVYRIIVPANAKRHAAR
jgi:hypothetical protein